MLFVAEFAGRQRIAKMCCLAWNIGLFPEATERERQTEQVLDLILADVVPSLFPISTRPDQYAISSDYRNNGCRSSIKTLFFTRT